MKCAHCVHYVCAIALKSEVFSCIILLKLSLSNMNPKLALKQTALTHEWDHEDELTILAKLSSLLLLRTEWKVAQN